MAELYYETWVEMKNIISYVFTNAEKAYEYNKTKCITRFDTKIDTTKSVTLICVRIINPEIKERVHIYLTSADIESYLHKKHNDNSLLIDQKITASVSGSALMLLCNKPLPNEERERHV